VTTRREYSTNYARRRRLAAWSAVAESATHCPALLANRRPCRTPLQSRFVDGVTVPFCPTCDLKRRGVCIDCREQPVYGTVGKALRCAACARLAMHASNDRYKDRNKATLRRKARRRAVVHREDRIAYKKLYRQSKPQKVAALKKQWYEANREKALEYHRQYREAHRAEIAARERARNHGALPPRTCLSCDTVLTGRPKKCDPCKQKARADARAAIAARMIPTSTAAPGSTETE
jgi:hypothetical protein